MLRCTRVLCLGLSALALVGCARLSKAYPERRQFRLALAPSAEAAPASGGKAILRVARFTASALFEKTEFVYRVTDHVWETDFYNVFLVPPATQIGDEVAARLAKSGLFAQVTGPGSIVEPTHVLEGHIRSLYADVRDRKAPKAVVHMELTLFDVRSDSPKIALHKAFEVSSPIAPDSLGEPKRGEAIVAALDTALTGIVAEFEKGLRDVAATPAN